MKRLLRGFHVIALLFAVAMPAIADDTPLPGDSVYQVDAHVVDQDGRPLAWRQLRGRPTMVSMRGPNNERSCPRRHSVMLNI